MTIYALGTTLAGLFLLGQESLIAVSGIKSGSHLYNRMFHTLFRATMEFFDQTPKGRIMARISSDTDQLDNVIAGMISILVNTSLQMVGTFIVVVTSALWFIFIVPLLVFLYIRIYLVFIAAYRFVVVE
jgi:ABC-type multidrug transport system fused ATPase/permease subunit